MDRLANSDTRRAVAWMLASIAANTAELILVHALGRHWPAPLQLFWRQAAGLLILTPLIVRSGRAVFVTGSAGILLFRCAAAMGGLLLWIYALSHLPLATATTLSFTRPLFVVLLARVALGERIGAFKALAVCLGFAGVLVMMRPHAEMGAAMGAPLAEGAALLSSLLFALSFVSIKAMTANNNPLTIVVYSCIFGAAVSAVPAAAQWQAPTWLEALLLAGLGVASVSNFGCMLKALSLQGAAALMPMDYLRLPVSMLAGYLLFTERPDATALAGAVLILLAALATALDKPPPARVAG
jgi:drug/metabolite transporter (DMT)-like permease